MATPLANGMILESVFYCNLVGQFSANVRHWQTSTLTGGPVTDEDALSNLSTAFAPLAKAWMNTDTEYFGAKLQIISPTRSPAVTTQLGSGAGALMSDALPDQVAAVIKLTTNLIGRSKRGRVYLSGFTEAANAVDNSVALGTQALINAMGNFLALGRTVVVGGSSIALTPVIYSRKLGTAQAINAFKLHEQWGTIRRRSQINRGDAPPPL